MSFKPLTVRTLLTTITSPDYLFGGHYTLDPYQNCSFGCQYCDSAQDETIYIKINAPEILKQELHEHAKGTIVIGSVHDPYQPAEQTAQLTRRLLPLIDDQGFSVHILTKSPLVLRDLDLLSALHTCRVTLSIPSLSENITGIIEPRVPSAKERLQIIQELHTAGISTGLAVMPLLPYFVEPELESIVSTAYHYHVDYLLYKPLELKGDQYTRYTHMLKRHFPQLVTLYEQLYHERYLPDQTYLTPLTQKLEALCKQYGIPTRLRLNETKKIKRGL